MIEALLAAQRESFLSESAKVWITGAGGLIGNYLVELAPKFAPQFAIIPLTHGELELTNFAAVEERFAQDTPDLMIHCAAISRSPVCQENPKLAWQINVDVTKHLAELARDIPFIFFSSDLVFDGRKGNYVETDAPNPLSVYAETKVAAEQLVLRNARHTVIRASLNGGRSPKGNQAFNEEMRRVWRAGQAIKLFSDEFRCPIPAAVTAQAVWELAAQDKPGVYHLGGSEKLSRAQIGQLVAARCPELNPRIEIGSLKEYRGAPRPADASLNCARIQKLLSFPLPGLGSWLRENSNADF